MIGYLSADIPHADTWRGTGYEIEHSSNGPVVTIRLPGDVNLHLRSDSADDLMKFRAVLTAAITSLGYGEDLPPMDAVQRVIDEVSALKQLAGARAELLRTQGGDLSDSALWSGTQTGLASAARVVTRELVGAALVQSLNEAPEPPAVTELLKCECAE